jgi:hypothetical protein
MKSHWKPLPIHHSRESFDFIRLCATATSETALLNKRRINVYLAPLSEQKLLMEIFRDFTAFRKNSQGFLGAKKGK